jgi:hypothetical protein
MNPYSNAPEGYPDVSDSGYPLRYLLQADPTDPTGRRSVPVPGMPVYLVYDGNPFNTVEEIERYKRAVERHDENLENWRRAWEAEVHNGLFPAEGENGITQEEAWHLRQVSMRKGDWIWYFACSGSNVAINRLKNDSFYNPAPEGWKFTPRDNHRFVNVPELWEE